MKDSGATYRFRSQARSKRPPGAMANACQSSLHQLPAVAADALEIEPGDRCVLLVVLGAASSVPLSLGHNYFPLRRLPDLHDVLKTMAERSATELSITQALRVAGVESYRRHRTQLSARLPTVEESKQLRTSRAQPVIETESVDVSSDGIPVTYARTCFRADRLQFVVGD